MGDEPRAMITGELGRFAVSGRSGAHEGDRVPGTPGTARTGSAPVVRGPASRIDPSALAWAPRALDASEVADPTTARLSDAVVVEQGEDRAAVMGGVSGAVPLFVAPDAASGTLRYSSRLSGLVGRTGEDGTRDDRAREGSRADGPGLRVDWDAWAHILSAGAPLGGRTTFAGIRRLRPWESAVVERAAGPGGTDRVSLERGDWPWLRFGMDAEETAAKDRVGQDPASYASDAERERIEALGEALEAALGRLTAHHRPISFLSGGWDSRILAAYAKQVTGRAPEAWTTSSDTGIVLEELVAAQAARILGSRHRIVAPRVDRFEADLRAFARSVDHQTSYHVWLVPLVDALARAEEPDAEAGSAQARSASAAPPDADPGIVLDGLGGGLMVGGDFTAGGSRAARIAGLTKYLKGASQVLRPDVVAGLQERTDAALDEFDAEWPSVADHPFEATFTAYLNRTLPGIGLAPYGLVAERNPVATPFLDHRVAAAALAIPADRHAAGRLYPLLLERLDPRLARLSTAQELVPWPRPHPRRIAAPSSVAALRTLVTEGPARRLLAPGLAEAGPDRWRGLLLTTGPQHLLRSLAVLNLWLEDHGDDLTGPGVEELLP